MTFFFDMDFVYRAFLVILRLGALMFFIPIFQARGLPSITKAGLIILLATLATMVVPGHPPAPTHAFGLIATGLNEVMVGLLMGLMIRIAFQTVYMAGELIALKAGFMADASFNPISQQSSGALERLMSQLAVVIFLAMGMHLQIFSAFIKSFEIAQMGQWLPSQGSLMFLVHKIAEIFSVSVQIAAPFIAINFIINMTFAVLGKAAPQMNVFILSFAIMMGISFIILAFGVDVITAHIMELMHETARNVLLVLQASK